MIGMLNGVVLDQLNLLVVFATAARAAIMLE